MGNSASTTLSNVEKINSALIESRLSSKTFESITKLNLPRSTKVGDRFTHDKTLFPDFVQYTISDLFSRRREARETSNARETYTNEFLETNLPVSKPDKNMLVNGPKVKQMNVTWLGHASVLTQVDGWNILADPIFSERCSPFTSIGPKRLTPSPVQSADLPPIDVIIISHNHYDHLDLTTVRDLHSCNEKSIWFVPLGMKEWFTATGVSNVIELDWSERVEMKDESGKNRTPISISCVPCQHWCARTPWDRNKCLWSSWVTETENGTFFFGGDTGYCPVFKDIGNIFKIHVAALPIGAYGMPWERFFHKPNHMDPAEAVQTHIDLKAKHSLAIHWGTFQLTSEPILEPPQKLKEALEEKKLGKDSFCCYKHGETKSYELEDNNVEVKI